MQANDHFNCFVKDSTALDPTGHGTLDGRTFAVKDCIPIEGCVPSFGHEVWRSTHSKSENTAPIVTKLLIAGAAMEGLTKLDQLTYSLVGNVGEGEAPINPLYLDRFTGGSSSGSASAVAGELVDFALGTDTAGSVRVPAAACGLYGIRPTHGRIDSTGNVPLAQSFDTIGLLARDPELLRAAFAVVTNEPDGSATPAKQLVLAADCLDIVEPDVAEAVRQAAARLSQVLDLQVEKAELGSNLFGSEVSDLFLRIQSREIWANHSRWVTEHMHELAPGVQDRLQNLCKKFAASSDDEKQADFEAKKKYREQFTEFVKPGTIIIKPVTPSLPPERSYGQDEPPTFRQLSFRLTSPAGLAGAPEVVVPIKLTSGLTFGVGLLGAIGEDVALLDAAVTLG